MAEDKERSIFRKEAQSRLTSLDQIDEMIQVVPRSAWITLYTLCALLFCVLLWGIFGDVPTRVQGQGILLSREGSIFNAAAPEGSGWISSITVNLGDKVTKDTVVAYLNQPDIDEELDTKKAYLEKLQAKYDELTQRSEKEIAERNETLSEQKAILEKMLATEEENSKRVGELMKVYDESYKKGLSTRQEAANVEQNYYSTLKSIEQIRENIKQNKISADDFVNGWKNRLHEHELTIEKVEYEIQELEAKRNISTGVKSPIDGIVTTIHVAVGDVVENGKSIVSVASTGKGLDAIVYFPPDQGKRIKNDMPALISPSTVKREEYGSIRGVVVSASEFPSTQESIVSVLQNEALAKQFLETGAPIAVRIRLNQDKDTVSGYEWSSSQGPDQSVTPGTLVEGQVTVRKQPPITLVLPALKKLVGIE